MSKYMQEKLNGWNVVGHVYGDIVFKKDGKYKSLKATLPKNNLVLDIGIDSSEVDRHLRDYILNLARDCGRKYYLNKEGKTCLYPWDAVNLTDKSE